MNKYLRAYYGNDLVFLVTFLRKKTRSNDIAKMILEYAMNMQQIWRAGGKLNQEATYRGKIHGLCRRWNENGQLREEIMYKDGNRHGLQKVWYVSGKLFEKIMYKDGEWHGLYKSWYENGQCCEEKMYEYGLRHGFCNWWHANGQLLEKRTYKYGRLQ